ncbi:MAG: rhamnogalacturonan acetylesterase, partial [Lacunisphaera sp.]
MAFALAAVSAFAESTSATSWKFDFTARPTTSGATYVHATDIFSDARGYGFDLGTRPTADGKPFFFSVVAPEGNYRVHVTFGDRQAASHNTVKAETRQLMIEHVATKPGEFVTKDFVVNLRNSQVPPPEKNAPGGSAVALNDREKNLLRWDDKLTLEFNGSSPKIAALTIDRVEAPTVFLAGDSTVTDQGYEPAASWGQMLPRFLTGVTVANHAESGETMKSFISGLRLAKVLSEVKTGDYLFIQFGHND